MSVFGWIIVIVAALALGLVAQLLIKTEALPYRWVISAVGAFLGAIAGSEWLFPTATPEFEGIAVWPAIIGGLIVGVVVDLLMVWYDRTQLHGGQGHGAAVR